jgi:hypothetical protein
MNQLEMEKMRKGAREFENTEFLQAQSMAAYVAKISTQLQLIQQANKRIE